MSIILNAVRIREARRAPTLASLHGDPRPRQTLPRVFAGAAMLALVVLAGGLLRLQRVAPPLAEADIPMLQPAARRPAARIVALASPSVSPSVSPSASQSPLASEPSPGAATQPMPARAPAASAPAAPRPRIVSPAATAFRPPTTLKQPIPTPVAALPPGQPAGRVPPPPATAGVEPAPVAAEAATPVAAAPAFQPLGDLPQTVREAIERMRVNALLYAPVARHRLVVVEGRQLREGDDVMAGVRLDEIKPQGLVLRHGSVRVLLPTALARPPTQGAPSTINQEAT